MGVDSFFLNILFQFSRGGLWAREWRRDEWKIIILENELFENDNEFDLAPPSESYLSRRGSYNILLSLSMEC